MALLTAAALAAGTGAALPPDDLEAARVAWRYFERNHQPATGLVNAVDGYPNTSLWDLGSSLVATVAALDLGLVPPEAFDERVTAMLRTLEALPLFRGELPNKAYDAATGAMTDYRNAPSARGIGWSALDLGRFAAALQILARLHPEHRPAAQRVLRRWNACALAANGELQGAVVSPAGEVSLVQEGRLGYEQYAAHALSRLGLDLSGARRWDRFTAEEDILGVRVRRDTRDRRRFGAIDALATEPWALAALELGLDAQSAPLVRGVFDVQKRRWERTGVVTAATEDHVDRPPWFVYGAVWADGRPWRTITPAGDDAQALQALSTKAAFALAAIYPDDAYARVLRAAIAGAKDPERGWYAGVYERGGTNRALTANTNGAILEALLATRRGPLLGAPGESGLTVPRCPTPGRGATGDAGDAARGMLAAFPGAAPGPIPGPGQVPAPRPPGARALRLEGQVFSGYRGADRATVGAIATLRPFGSAFLRAGGELTPFSPYGESRLLWGAGFEDWRPNTFFAHVDDWGPIRADQRYSSRTVEATAGYKLPSPCAFRALCLAPVAAMVVPFAGGPYAQARATLTLFGSWFVMGGVGRTIPGVFEGPVGTPTWRFVYGFGRTTWRPGSVFVTYHDWGPDSRSGNGVLAVGVNWAW